MLKRVFLAVPLAALLGCSVISLEILPGTMDRLGNERYGYHFLIPDKWKRSVNSDIRPTELEIRAPKTDAAIIVMVMEGGSAPEEDEFVAKVRHRGTETFNLIRKWPVPFDDNTGYIVNFTWKGTTLFGTKQCGKRGKEYEATVAVVDRSPTPILLFCYAPKEKFADMYQEYFGDVRGSLKVEPVEITVREIQDK